MSVIKPTVGRKLWLFFNPELPRRAVVSDVCILDYAQPMDASVAYVFPTNPGDDFDRITISFADHAGAMRWHTVPLRQEGQPQPDAREWCEWPAFPKAQSAVASPAGSDVRIGLTPADIRAAITATVFHRLPGTQITVCELTLRNGAKVLGHNYSSIDPNHQDWAQGEDAAFAMAREKVWELEGYLLRERLHKLVPTVAE